jgi:hypothetical protein
MTRRLLIVAAAAAMLVGCGGERAQDGETPAAAPRDAITRTTHDGPVRATVSLAPGEPTLTEPLTLTLTVEAEPGVTVEMPPFGDALGRFTIADFTPRASRRADGTVTSQTYTLQAPMSGRQRIPPLRVVYLDERGTSGDDSVESRELLTDEIAVQIASVLPDGPVAHELRPARGKLVLPSTSLLVRYGPVAAGALAFAGLLFAWRTWRRGAARRAKISAFDVAMGRLAGLEERGMPGPGEADDWYVELSSIVRRYIEDRFGVRAPELTTEEFLREARRSRELSGANQELLSRFLEGCDRVKFAAYEPEEAESREAISLARRFLEDTRFEAAADAAGAGGAR